MPIEIARTYFKGNPKSNTHCSVFLTTRRAKLGGERIPCYIVVDFVGKTPVSTFIYDDGASAFEIMHSLCCDGKVDLYVK